MLVPKLRFKREDGTEYSEWVSKQVSEFANCFAGATPSTSIKEYWENGTISWLSSGEVNKKQIYETNKKITQLGYDKSSTKMVKPNSVVIALAGQGKTRGTVAITRVPVCTNQSLCAIETNDIVIDDYLYQYFGTRYDDLRNISSGDGTRGGLNLKLINSYNVPIPCLEEQQKIADFLSTIDEVIAQSEAEVQNLEQQKKSAMQKIFSQEVRFKREDGTEYHEWRNKSFANAFIPLNNNTFSRDMLSENGTVLNIHYGDILVKFGEVCDIQTMDIPKVNADIDTSKYDVLLDGDIILADTAEDETVGKAIEIYHTGTSKVVSGLHTMACRPNDKYAPKYMGYYINSPTYHNQLLLYMQGIKVTSIGRKNIADTVIYYPADLEEQQKIADFLSAYDEAISYAKQELDKWKELKKGLLQQMFV